MYRIFLLEYIYIFLYLLECKAYVFDLGYHCYFMVGHGLASSGNPNLQIYEGVTMNSNECVIRCIGKIQEYPDINGVSIRKTDGCCFCEIKMVKSNGRTDYGICFLTSKTMLV